MIKVSLIVAVYKDIKALELILDSLLDQTYTNFEVVVAEDAQREEMLNFISFAKEYYPFEIKHTCQEDIGVRKARSQNNAILVAEGEYLIFIDGDCLLYSTFIEGHISLSAENRILSGRRVNIPIEIVPKVKKKLLNIRDIEKNYIKKYFFWIFKPKIRYRQGIYINPKSFLYKLINIRKPSSSLLGCNFSCWRENILEINGFDESYEETAIPDDIDLQWRFRENGQTIYSCKNVANMFHLDHKIHDRGDATPLLKIMYQRKKEKLYICEKGINTHYDK